MPADFTAPPSAEGARVAQAEPPWGGGGLIRAEALQLALAFVSGEKEGVESLKIPGTR